MTGGLGLGNQVVCIMIHREMSTKSKWDFRTMKLALNDNIGYISAYLKYNLKMNLKMSSYTITNVVF